MLSEPFVKGARERIDLVGGLIEKASGLLCVLFGAFMAGMTILGVVFRYFMSSPFQWTEELARFLMLGMCFLAINIALRRKQHIAIRLVVDYLPKTIVKIIDYISDGLMAFFLVVLFWRGCLMATNTMMTGHSIDISMFWPYLTMPVGIGLTMIQLILVTADKVLVDLGPKTKRSVS